MLVIPYSLKQVDQGGLARATGTDDGDMLSLRQGK
jgi:hypothetical protein